LVWHFATIVEIFRLCLRRPLVELGNIKVPSTANPSATQPWGSSSIAGTASIKRQIGLARDPPCATYNSTTGIASGMIQNTHSRERQRRCQRTAENFTVTLLAILAFKITAALSRRVRGSARQLAEQFQIQVLVTSPRNVCNLSNSVRSNCTPALPDVFLPMHRA